MDKDKRKPKHQPAEASAELPSRAELALVIASQQAAIASLNLTVGRLEQTVGRLELGVGRLLVVLERQLASNDHAMERSRRALAAMGNPPTNDALREQLHKKLRESRDKR